jgi:hypothetical protein
MKRQPESGSMIALPRHFLHKGGMQGDVPHSAEKPRIGKTLLIISWTAIGVALALSPFLAGTGEIMPLVVLIIPWPIAVGTFILGLVVAIRGRRSQGVWLIIGATLTVPLCLTAQCGTLLALGSAALNEQRWQETRMLENLRTIDHAKGQWIAETNAPEAASVTMADLTSYLGGKEMTPVVRERYDPKPVGDAPTATLPKEKHLWDYPLGGAAYTIAGLEQILANQVAPNPIDLVTGEMLHPSGRTILDWLKAKEIAPEE